jgi:transcriptional regulator with XRE-family HTH domain
VGNHGVQRYEPVSPTRIMSPPPEAQQPKLTLGEWICIIRSRAGVTRQELAADLGVFRVVVSQWEADETVPNIEQFRDITELCSARWLWETVRNGDVLIGPEAKEARGL